MPNETVEEITEKTPVEQLYASPVVYEYFDRCLGGLKLTINSDGGPTAIIGMSETAPYIQMRGRSKITNGKIKAAIEYTIHFDPKDLKERFTVDVQDTILSQYFSDIRADEFVTYAPVAIECGDICYGLADEEEEENGND